METGGCKFGGAFWERKMKTYFRRLDIDGDAYVTQKDFQRLADRYAEVGKLDEVKAKQVQRKLAKVWSDYLEEDSINGKVDEASFIQSIRDRKALIFETALQFHGLFFDLIDLSGDGVIQKNEFQIFFNVFGIEGAELADECFKGLDADGDGLLSHDEFVHAGFQYFHGEDENHPSKFLYGPLIAE